jgi:hypothetical protein
MAEQAKQLELAKLQAEVQELQARAMERQAGAQLDQAKARSEGSAADMKDLDFIEEESGVKHQRDLEKQGAQAEANMRRDLLNAGNKEKQLLLNALTKAAMQPNNTQTQ